MEPDTSWEDHCWKRRRIFLDVYHGYEIWLDKETYKRIQAFEQASREVMGKFSIPRAVNESEDERWATWDALRRDVLTPKLDELSDALRAEMQATPTTILWRLVLHAVERIERKPNPR